MKERSRDGRRDGGFTLVELLVSIVILGIISFALTESVILGLKTTEGTGSRVSSSSATQALGSFFTNDAKSADKVSTNALGCTPPGFLNLTWVDKKVVTVGDTTRVDTINHYVSYTLMPATGVEQDVLRWSCTDEPSSTPVSRAIGHFSHPQTSNPVLVSCDAPPTCPASPVDSQPTSVTLTIQTEASPAPADTFTVRRRSR